MRDRQIIVIARCLAGAWRQRVSNRYRGRQENVVVPDDGGRMAAAGNFRLPADVFPFGFVPVERRIGVRRYARGQRPAPLGPVVGRNGVAAVGRFGGQRAGCQKSDESCEASKTQNQHGQVPFLERKHHFAFRLQAMSQTDQHQAASAGLADASLHRTPHPLGHGFDFAAREAVTIFWIDASPLERGSTRSPCPIPIALHTSSSS